MKKEPRRYFVPFHFVTLLTFWNSACESFGQQVSASMCRLARVQDSASSGVLERG